MNHDEIKWKVRTSEAVAPNSLVLRLLVPEEPTNQIIYISILSPCDDSSHPTPPCPGTTRIAHRGGSSGVECELPSHKVISSPKPMIYASYLRVIWVRIFEINRHWRADLLLEAAQHHLTTDDGQKSLMGQDTMDKIKEYSSHTLSLLALLLAKSSTKHNANNLPHPNFSCPNNIAQQPGSISTKQSSSSCGTTSPHRLSNPSSNTSSP